MPLDNILTFLMLYPEWQIKFCCGRKQKLWSSDKRKDKLANMFRHILLKQHLCQEYGAGSDFYSR